MAIDQRWKDTVRQGIKDARWDEYDSLIKTEVDGYAVKFQSLTSKVNWLLIKAMLWVESGGPSNKAWSTRPLQIGNTGDPAYAVLKSGTEGADLIMSDSLKNTLASSSIDNPDLNIKAGIAYLYTRMAVTNIVSIRDVKNDKEYEYQVVAGDSLEKISKKVGTTIFELRRLNPKSSGVLKIGQKLKYVKAAMQRTIVGWREFTSAIIADRYNGGGDPNYSAKLTYILDEIFPNLVRTKKP